MACSIPGSGSTSLASSSLLHSTGVTGVCWEQSWGSPSWIWGAPAPAQSLLPPPSAASLSLQHPAELWGPPSPPQCRGAPAAWAVSSAPRRVARVTSPGTGATMTPAPLVSCTPLPAHPCSLGLDFLEAQLPQRHSGHPLHHFSPLLLCVTPSSLDAKPFLQHE